MNTQPEALGPRPTVDAAHLSRTRATVLDSLRDLGPRTRIRSLADHLGQHPNTVREHLDGLVDDDLVERVSTTPEGRGRPAWAYTAVSSTSNTAREYAGLATALASQLRSLSETPSDDAAAAGRMWGAELARRSGPTHEDLNARRRVVTILAEMGFAPTDDGDVVRLRRCPLLDAAKDNTDIICAVHTGLVQGSLEEMGDSSHGVQMEPFAEPGACRLRLP